MFQPNDIEAFNKDVRDWTKQTRQDAVSAMSALGIMHSEKSRSPIPLRETLKTNITKQAGLPSRIRFRMPRHAVFVHKGVGRGTPIDRVGQTGRKPKPFLNPAIEKNIGRLVDIVADNQGTMIVNAITVK